MSHRLAAHPPLPAPFRPTPFRPTPFRPTNVSRPATVTPAPLYSGATPSPIGSSNNSDVVSTAGAVRSGAVWCGSVWCGAIWCGAVWCGLARCGAVRSGAVRSGAGAVWRGAARSGPVRSEDKGFAGDESMLVSPLLTPQDQVTVASGWFIEDCFGVVGGWCAIHRRFCQPLVLDLGAVRHSRWGVAPFGAARVTTIFAEVVCPLLSGSADTPWCSKRGR
jgi:hypothetical protein